MTAPRIKPGTFALANPPVDQEPKLSRQERRRINRRLDAGKSPPPEFAIKLNFDKIAEFFADAETQDLADGDAQ